jgi:excisionase family DNA binding protein
MEKPMSLKKVKEVAVLLNTSERNIYYKIRDGIIPAVRIGRMTRIRESDLEAIIGVYASYQSEELAFVPRREPATDELQ